MDNQTETIRKFIGYINISDDYLDLHLIPRNRELWEVENYEKFVEERTRLILEKFDYLIIKETEGKN